MAKRRRLRMVGTTTTRRIGLLGGTFDPPHNGHLLLAQLAQKQLPLDQVLWLPVGNPTHKSRHHLTPAFQRAEMVRLLIAPYTDFILDMTDVEREPPHYISSLLPILREQHPSAEFWLLIGEDSLRDFYRWHRPNEILAQCRLAVLPRPDTLLDWQLLTENCPTLPQQIDWLDHEGVAISSTQLREKHDENSPTSPAVFAYILKNQLYQLD